LGKPYSEELDRFSSTFGWAEQQKVDTLRNFLKRWNGDHALVVGSGGSYSAAATISLFRELAFHSPTTAVSPLECVATLDRLVPHVFLLSAEGKNKDILSAAECAAEHDLCSGALTLTTNNPLTDFAAQSGALRVFGMQMTWGKDGYLATNTLVAMVLVFFRVFFGDAAFTAKLAPLFDEERLKRRRKHFQMYRDTWFSRPGGFLVIYSMDAQSFAIDLESKLAEAAIDLVQIADLRQFAHGRHLQLASDQGPVVLVAYSARDEALAKGMIQLFPSHIKPVEVLIDGETPEEIAVAGIVDATLITEAIAKPRDYDPGRPAVPEFGRQIYALDVRRFSVASRLQLDMIDVAARRKMQIPDGNIDPVVRQSAATYYERLLAANLKAVVCDYDGTLCRAENRYEKPSEAAANEVIRLIRQGMVFTVATGRGDSLKGDLQAVLPVELHSSIWIGYYSGAYLVSLSEPFNRPEPNPEFLLLWDWLGKSAYRSLCSRPLESVARAGQLSLRVASARQSASLRAAIRAWLDSNGCRAWRVFSSGHSVDVLDATTSKRNVVDAISTRFNIDPLTQVLRLGDCGQEEGNDFELLGDGLSLSCDSVSADLSTCWNFGLCGCNQTETTLLYLRSLQPASEGFQFDPDRSLLGRVAP
jgi:hypothetical protein